MRVLCDGAEFLGGMLSYTSGEQPTRLWFFNYDVGEGGTGSTLGNLYELGVPDVAQKTVTCTKPVNFPPTILKQLPQSVTKDPYDAAAWYISAVDFGSSGCATSPPTVNCTGTIWRCKLRAPATVRVAAMHSVVRVAHNMLTLQTLPYHHASEQGAKGTMMPSSWQPA